MTTRQDSGGACVPLQPLVRNSKHCPHCGSDGGISRRCPVKGCYDEWKSEEGEISGSWDGTRTETPKRIYCADCHKIRTDVTWDDVSISWDNITTRWDGKSAEPLFPIVLLNSNDGYTFKRTSTVNNDNGVLIDAFWESKDYTALDLDSSSIPIQKPTP